MTVNIIHTRYLLLAALALLAATALYALAPAFPIAEAQEDDHHSEQVQVRARLQADGDIEFGLRTSEGNVLPRQRVFSARINDERWRVSSPLELVNGAEVQIIARRDGDSRVEFGVRTRDPREDYLPSRNKFSRSTPVGRWLISTPVSIPAPEADDEQEQDDQPAPYTEDDTDNGDTDTEESSSEETEEADDHERISGGHRDGLIVVEGVLGNPDAPVLISEYGDPF